MTVKKIGRLEFQIVPGSEQLFTSNFAEFLIAAYDKFRTLINESVSYTHLTLQTSDLV